MRVVGEAMVRAPVGAVWAALHDPELLAHAIPGGERFELAGRGSADFIVSVGRVPLSGTFAGRLTAVNQDAPRFIALSAQGSGDHGSFAVDVTVRLRPGADGATLISYDAMGAVDGAISLTGTRLLAASARRLASEFFAEVESLLPAQPRRRPASAAVTGPAKAAGPAEPVALVPAAPASGLATPAPWATPAPSVRPAPVAPSRGGRADFRAALAAGLVIALAGIIVGILIGRGSRPARRDRS